jgi:hypothetical protein
MRIQALAEFPELDKFEDQWPVKDLIKMRLKYTSSLEKGILRKKAASLETVRTTRSSSSK